MAYATKADLAAYLGVSEADLPPDADRLLERASELIDYVTMGRADAEAHADTLRRATCAQAEMWISEGEDVAIRGPIRSFSLGKWSVTYGDGRQSGGDRQPELAPRARQALALAGLLYRGVGAR